MELLNRAYDFCEDGEFEEAIKLYDKVLSQDSENLKAIIDKGVALQNLEDLNNALEHFEYALIID